MEDADTAGIGVDPGNGIGASFDAGANVQLKDEVLRRVSGNDVHGAEVAIERFPFGLVIVETRAKTVRPEGRGGGGELVAKFFPGIEIVRARAGEDDDFAAEDLIEFYGFANAIAGRQGLE